MIDPVHALCVSAALLLLAGGFAHIRNWKVLFASLIQHDVLPYRLARRLSQVLPALQLVIGTALLVATLCSRLPLVASRVIDLGAATLYAAMTCYLAVVVAGRSPKACACFGSRQPINALSVGRTLVLGAGSAAAATEVAEVGIETLAASTSTGVVLAGLLAVVPRVLPDSATQSGHVDRMP